MAFVSGFSYVRNGFEYGVPFLESIQSILPICQEFVIAVGNSSDGTKEAIENLHSDKIKIIDTVWDMNLKEGGKIFAQQCNIALDNIKGDWAFHIQADEVMHEKSLPIILKSIEEHKNNKKLDGFIFPFLHFWGDYEHIRNTRRVHKYEVRLFRNTQLVRSFKDSQGFRKYESLQQYHQQEEKGLKLNVKKIDEPVYHYNGVRSKKAMAKKTNHFQSFYGLAQFEDKPTEDFEDTYDLNFVDRVMIFKGEHPLVMQSAIKKHHFVFNHDKTKAIWSKKDKLLQPIEDVLGFKFGEYKNYKLI